jgi:beta-lactamase class A
MVLTAAVLDPLRACAGVRWSAAVRVAGVAVDELDAGVVLPTASVGKVLLLASVLAAIERDELDPGELLDVTDDDLVADSGLLQHLACRRLSLADLCRFVAAVSDNLATNVLIRRVRLDRVAATTAQLELTRCALHDVVRDERGAEHPPHLSTGAAGELAALMERIDRGEAISPRVSAGLAGLLRLNTDLSMVAAGFGLDPLAHAGQDLGIRLFNKTGTQSGVRADIGCISVTSEGEAVTACYAVVARFADSPAVRNAVLSAMGAVGAGLLTATRAG